MLFSKAFSDCSVIRLVAVAGFALPLASCAARQVTPVSMTQPTDDRLTCSEIDQGMKSNQAAAAELLQKNKEVDQANAAKVVASVLLSGWFALTVDLSNEEQIKMRALADRNEALALLKAKKKCAA
jgi:recombinational DNA repair protein (RecF pathway)